MNSSLYTVCCFLDDFFKLQIHVLGFFGGQVKYQCQVSFPSFFYSCKDS